MPYFYETETPVRVEAEGGSFEYYTEAKKLTIARPSWTDAWGQKCRGKTVTVDVSRFSEQTEPLVELLYMVIAELKNTGGTADG